MDFNKNKRVENKHQETKKAISNFGEVNFSYTKEEAILEASRCLSCIDAPCVSGCPLGNNIPSINKLIKEGEFDKAYLLANETNPLMGICGRVCQQENQCEKVCKRGKIPNSEPIAIGRLERFLYDFHQCGMNATIKNPIKNPFSIAIIGSGPAGLSCACKLSQDGFKVTIYEKENICGGLLVYGIPEFCLPHKIVFDEIETLKKRGVKFLANSKIGDNNKLDNIIQSHDYDAVFIAHGANKPRLMNIIGEYSFDVYNANEYLSYVNVPNDIKSSKEENIYHAKNVVIVGGGNVAIDCDRAALRLKANKVYNLYRRSEKEMPARKEEYQNAINEGIDFRFLTNPIEILLDENEHVKGVKCIKMKLGEADASGRSSPIPIEGSEFVIDCDLIIMALGSVAETNDIASKNGINIDKHGYYLVNEKTMETNKNNFYAGGDAVTGPTTVVQAIKAGLLAAKSIEEKLLKKTI